MNKVVKWIPEQKIDSCSQCPYHILVLGRRCNYPCCITDRYLHDYPAIPSWCPLLDYKPKEPQSENPFDTPEIKATLKVGEWNLSQIWQQGYEAGRKAQRAHHR